MKTTLKHELTIGIDNLIALVDRVAPVNKYQPETDSERSFRLAEQRHEDARTIARRALLYAQTTGQSVQSKTGETR
jgi:hypothetical protein